ncbi:MAG: NAD(P)-binding protein [Bacteroidetes bacterium]|nr:NAD(P)-binding protein [Bacteroidota bacterium]
MGKEKHAVVGAGLCGTLLAVRLAQRGFTVDLYERRPDLRKADLSAGRSINLALSDRGLKALDLVGATPMVKDLILPMKGRLLHDIEGNTKLSRYSGREENYINSISRSGLNAVLLDMAEDHDNVQLYFNHSCTHFSPDEAHLKFKTDEGSEIARRYDRVFGTDGAGSAIRQSFMARSNQIRFDFEQSFLSHGYKELSFPPTSDGNFAVFSEALHIWPRDDFMMIALPNLDRSFTVTLFQSYEGKYGFDSLNEEQEIRYFFETYFPDAVQHMPHLVTEFHENPSSSLGTIKCSPWHIRDKVLMMGDAVHAIVPFYGQGMNCAFEDVLVFDAYLDKYGDRWHELFKAYSSERKVNTDAIADLALDNFHEMQDHVNDKNFGKKRELEMILENNYRDYDSKYSLVTFRPDLSYRKALDLGRKQDEYLLRLVDTVNSIQQLSLEKVMNDIRQIHQSHTEKELTH